MLRALSRRAYWLIGVGFLIGISAYHTPDARAQNATAPSVADLQQRVQDLEAVVRKLQDSPNLNAAPTAPVSLPSSSGVAADSGPQAASEPVPLVAPVAGWNEGFYMQSPDKQFQLRITGQLQADFRGFLDPTDTSTTTNGNVAGSPVTGAPDTFLIRRARLGIEATMADYYEFRLLPDFAGSNISKSIADAYMNVHYWDALQFEFGKFKQPFSYEQLIQDRYVPSMERSMMDQLVPQRDEGFMIHGEKLFCNRFDYAVAISNGDPNDSIVDSNIHKDFNGRLVFRPFSDPERWDALRGLQFGIDGSVGVENEALSTTSSTTPIITTPATVTWFAYNTGVAANGMRDRISPELAYFYHSFGLCSQYYQQDQILQLTSHGALVDVPVYGYYVLATYLLTGEERTGYSQQIDPIHPFDPCAPLASSGAWELLFRVDKLEVGPQAFAAGLASNTGTLNRSSPAATETTLGVNWYLSKWARAQINWEHAEFASPIQIGNMGHALSSEDAIYTRFQVIF